MQNLNLILFLCFTLPLSLAVFVCGKKSKRVLLFFFFGTVICLFCGNIASILINATNMEITHYSEFAAPIIEEICKSLPIIIYTCFFNPKKRAILECSLLLGIAFGMLENAYVIALNSKVIVLSDFIGRAFGSGMMHGVCTFAVGYGMTFMHKKKSLFYLLITLLLLFAIIYHSIYNILILSSYKYIGFALPILAFIPLVIAIRNSKTEEET